DSAGWQFLQQSGAIVRRHLVNDLDDFLFPHRLKQTLLVVAAQVFEGLSGQPARENAKQNDLVFIRQVRDQFGDIGRRPFAKNLLERRKIALMNQRLNFGAKKLAEHGCKPSERTQIAPAKAYDPKKA